MWGCCKWIQLRVTAISYLPTLIMMAMEKSTLRTSGQKQDHHYNFFPVHHTSQLSFVRMLIEMKSKILSFGFRDFLTPGSRRGSIQVQSAIKNDDDSPSLMNHWMWKRLVSPTSSAFSRSTLALVEREGACRSRSCNQGRGTWRSNQNIIDN